MQQELERAQSRCLQSNWQLQLQQDPYAALVEWQTPECPKPSGAAELKALEEDMQKTRTGLLDQLALQLVAAVESGHEPAAQELAQAVAAGVLAADQVAALQQPHSPLGVEESCNWLRRIDERPDAEDSRLVVEIALSPLPVEQKQVLLRRMQATAPISPQRRNRMSRTLWNLYHAGSFGCPGDAEAMLCLGRLQEESLLRMTTQPEKETDRWLESLSHAGEEDWVCFE